MATITFIATGHTAPASSDFREATLTPKGREQTKSLRARFFEPPENQADRKGWKPKQFDLALIEPTPASQDMALMLLRKQVPTVSLVYLPALSPPKGRTAADIAELYQKVGNTPVCDWTGVDSGERNDFIAWIYDIIHGIDNAIKTMRADRTLVIGQAILLSHIARGWIYFILGSPFPISHSLLLETTLLGTTFSGGEGFELNVETGIAARI